MCVKPFLKFKTNKLAIVATDTKKRRCSPSPPPTTQSQTQSDDRNGRSASEHRSIRTPTSLPFSMPSTAPFLTWSPILLPPWGPALFPAALYPAALRSLPGFVFISFSICMESFYFY